MDNIIKTYRKVSLDILNILENDKYGYIDELLDIRENIVKNILESDNIEKFKEIYVEEVYSIDKNIQDILINSLEDIKKEIREYKLNKQGNYTYSKIKVENLNIFSKKV